MKIVIGADHGGYELKERLKEVMLSAGHQVNDVGCFSLASVDYPDIAKAVATEILDRKSEAGILVCGTGIGMSMAVNRHPQIRAALCHDEYTARMSREHNDANILCLGARVIGSGVAEALVATWLQTSFAGGRHQQRIDKFTS